MIVSLWIALAIFLSSTCLFSYINESWFQCIIPTFFELMLLLIVHSFPLLHILLIMNHHASFK